MSTENNKQYELLLSKCEKLEEENKQLQEELAYLNIGKDILFGANTIVDNIDLESLKKVYELLKKRHILAQILGM
jgi:cell division septum initiation protein DivIVA